jgi:hypothetical protein
MQDLQLLKMRDIRNEIAEINRKATNLSLEEKLQLSSLYMELEEHRRDRMKKAQRRYARGNGKRKNQIRALRYWRENNVVMKPRANLPPTK